jgi:enoyl-CoA hydratase/carnithine racemase
MYNHFRVEKANQIATITLDRPEKRNPINVEMLKEFEAILLELRDDAASRVVIVTGSGNSFCAGADLSIVKGIEDQAERRRRFAQARNQRIRLINRVFTMLENLEQVSIAAINGYAIGGGWGLALACDFPDGAGSAVLVSGSGPRRALESGCLGPTVLHGGGRTCQRDHSAV